MMSFKECGHHAPRDDASAHKGSRFYACCQVVLVPLITRSVMATVMATRLLIVFVTVTLLVIGTGVTRAQGPSIQYGDAVPAEVKQIYERGLDYLASEQQQDGSWSGGQQGSGITGMCLMAFLAHDADLGV